MISEDFWKVDNQPVIYTYWKYSSKLTLHFTLTSSFVSFCVNSNPWLVIYHGTGNIVVPHRSWFCSVNVVINVCYSTICHLELPCSESCIGLRNVYIEYCISKVVLIRLIFLWFIPNWKLSFYLGLLKFYTLLHLISYLEFWYFYFFHGIIKGKCFYYHRELSAKDCYLIFPKYKRSICRFGTPSVEFALTGSCNFILWQVFAWIKTLMFTAIE